LRISFANSGQTFVIDFFLGEVPSDVALWEKVEKLGVVSVFGGARFAKGKCGNCAQQASSETTRLFTGQFPITTILLDLIQNGGSIGGDTLTSLDREEVGNFLKKHMHWRAVGVSCIYHFILD
jgi:tyrosinase